MNAFLWIVIAIFAYWFLMFIASHLLIPNYGWKKRPLPTHISDQIQGEIDSLSQTFPRQGMFLRAAYELIGKRYVSTFTVLLHIPTTFMKSPEKLWNRKGKYIACHQMNLLLRIFLVKSKIFKDEDIRIKYTFINLTTHQYLQVYCEDNWVDVDIWGRKHNIPFGHHGSGFMSLISR